MPDYPQRPKFFAFKFCRLMAKVCLANEIGAETCWLLAVIAQCEDAKRYTAPVTYFNDHLAPLVGAGSVDALDRMRSKAVRAGWLNYTPGRKHVAGQYFVTIPPQFCGINDGASDEDGADYIPQKCGEKPKESAETTAREAEGKCGEKPKESAEHSTLALSVPLSLPVNPPLPPRGNRRRVAKTAADILADLDIPSAFLGEDNPARKAIDEWLAHKDRKRNQYSGPESFGKELTRWAKLGVARFVAAVDFSIGKDWKSIHEEQVNGSQHNHPRQLAPVGPGQRFRG